VKACLFNDFNLAPGVPLSLELHSRETEPERAREVLNYFLRHPQAADTLEGIARWRLMQEALQRGVEETSRALEWLVSKGFLREVSKPYSSPIYSLNHEETAKAEEFLAQGQSSEANREKD